MASGVFPEPALRLLIESFGVWRLSVMADRFGASCELLGMQDASGQCVFAMLFSSEPPVRKIWARDLEQAGCDPEFAFAPERVVMDFVAVPRQIRGHVMHYVVLALDYLRFCGYLSIASECQELRLLALWVRKGVRLLNPPPFEPAERIRCIADQRRRKASESPGLVTGLFDGERLFATGGTWQLFLRDPVYFTYDLDGEAFARLSESVLGTREIGLRLAPPDALAPATAVRRTR